jgi:hypothetical protein
MSQARTPKRAVPAYVEPEAYARLGQPRQPNQPKEAWQFNVRDFVPHIDPQAYFCTSGEAVIKARKLEQDLWRAAASARRLANLLTKARGKHKYLELQITGHGTICLTKDPRPNMRLINKQKHAYVAPEP